MTFPLDLGRAGKQRPEFYRPPEQPSDPVEAFRSHVLEFGLEILGPIASGKLTRLDIDKKGDKAGWYVFYLDDVCAGAFGNWKAGVKETWCSIDRQAMTSTQKVKYRQQVVDAKRQRQEEEAKRQKEARERIPGLLASSIPANPSHPYLVKKKIPPHSLRQIGQDLVVLVQDEKSEIHSLQFIKPDGSKKFLSGGRVKGCCYTIQGNEKLSIGEGVATMASVHAATGATCICAFNASNLEAVAKVVREACPTANITIIADNDRFTAGNPGITKAEVAAKAIGASVVFPVFEGLPGADDQENKLTDFNDLANVAGIEVVKAQIAKPVLQAKQKLPPQGPETTQFKGKVYKRPAALQFNYNLNDQGLIPKGVVGVITATGGTGKSFWLLKLALAGAAGGNFGPINAPKKLKTLVIVAEDTQDELERRAWDICKGQFPDDFHAVSVYGEIGPLMRLDGSTPVLADAYHWLESTIELHPDLDLLILDPKSRLYGLDENNNDHATAYVQCLEALSKKHSDLTILFSHHTGKEKNGKLDQDMSRGASALVDGCRWQAGLIRMDQKTADRFGLENPREYIIFDAPKSNYAADMPGKLIFKRGENGVLEWVDPGGKLLQEMGARLLELLKSDPEEYTKDELSRRGKGKGIAEDMKEDFPDFIRSKTMGQVVQYLLNKGLIYEEKGNAGKTTRKILIVA